MSSWREWLQRIWGSLHGGRSDRDLEEELRFHLESATRTLDAAATVQRLRIVFARCGVPSAVSLKRSS